MKIIFMNQAMTSYVEFMRRVIDMKKNPDEKTEIQYQNFISRYRQMKNNEEIKSSVSEVQSCCILDTDLIKIYYVDMPQLWAFLHLVIEAIKKQNLSFSFWSYTPEDFMCIKSILKRMWFIKKNQYGCSYIYLEDEDNQIDVELKLFHTRKGFEKCRENVEQTVKVCKATKYKMKEMFKNRA